MSPDFKLLSDEEIVGHYRNGREEAFDELYRRYAPRLKSLIYHHVGDAEDSDDIFHEVFLRVFRHLPSYNEERPFSSWIYQIAVNCSKNYRKKSARNEILIEREKSDVRDKTESESPEEMILQETDLREFYTAVDGLKDSFKTVFLLRFEQNLKYRDISEMLNCSERTAKWRMKKAVEIISDRLKDRGVI
jgi:RNA polymerase sigma-70 factor (ECF subfamily)